MDTWSQPTRLAAVAGAATLLGVLSLLSNITTWEQLTGQANSVLTVRFFLSELANSGTAWAGLMVLAGWLVHTGWQAAVAGVLAGELALVVHYGLAELIGPLLDLPPAGFATNEYWFVVAAVFGAPLGLAGALAHRPGAVGRLAGLVVPLGAVIEPFFRGSFRLPDLLPWPTRMAAFLSGVVLIAFGVVLAVKVLGLCSRTTEPSGGGAASGKPKDTTPTEGEAAGR
ncbi:MAG: hypothetical protein GXX86_08400 [Propionibacterium sp.]|nr:hypothetical protein [Propionibacterium sp.]